MPTIAQKLCSDFVEPILVPASNEITTTVPSRKSFKSVSGHSTIRFAKPSRSIVIEKKKVITQIEPTSRTVINKIKSKETILKKDFIDIGVNTYISGPLKSDNNCVTNVRKRDYNCSCKHGQKRNNVKTSSKQVQTLIQNCSRSDKACAYCVDTNNCSTQFMENFNSRLRTQISNRLLVKKSNDFDPQFSYRNTPVSSRITNPMATNKISKTMCPNARRWALSNNSRGPDF